MFTGNTVLGMIVHSTFHLGFSDYDEYRYRFTAILPTTPPHLHQLKKGKVITMESYTVKEIVAAISGNISTDREYDLLLQIDPPVWEN